MNIDNGHLIHLQEGEIAPQYYEMVPDYLESAAVRKLAGNDSAYISFRSGGKLSTWAAQKRMERKKQAKQSRKQNRGK